MAEPDRHRDGRGLRPGGQVGRRSRGSVYDSWYPGYDDAGRRRPQRHLDPDRDGRCTAYATPHFYTLDDFPTVPSRPDPSVFYPEPVEGRLVAAAGRGRVQPDGVEGRAAHGGASTARSCCTTSTRWGGTRSPASRRSRRTPGSFPQDQWDPPTAALHAGQPEDARHRGLQGRQARSPPTALLPGGHLGHPDERSRSRCSSRRCSKSSATRTWRSTRTRGRGSSARRSFKDALPAAVRHGRLDAAVPDGREGGRGELAARGGDDAGRDGGRARAGEGGRGEPALPDLAEDQQQLHRGQPHPQAGRRGARGRGALHRRREPYPPGTFIVHAGADRRPRPGAWQGAAASTIAATTAAAGEGR